MPVKKRCHWCGDDPLYVNYHDAEWGVPVYDDKKLFEFLILEGAQAGLAWITILRKREGYRKAFCDFNVEKVAALSDRELEQRLQDPGIVRNRLKVYSARTNAQAFMAVQKEFGSFSDYIWAYVDHKPKQNRCKTMADVPATSAESDALARDMKKRGFKFAGSTILYAHMQATGMVNDHTLDCFRYKEVAQHA